MKDNTKLVAILAMALGALLLLTHPQEANEIPFLTVSGGGASVDIGDYHYRSEGVQPITQPIPQPTPTEQEAEYDNQS